MNSVKHVVAACLAALLSFGAQTSAFAQQPAQQPENPDLALGIQQVEQGDLEAAVLTLDRAVRDLSSKGGNSRSLGRAYTYLAVAYMGLAQEAQARAKLIEAWKADPKLSLSKREFPPSLIKLFEDTMRAEGITVPPPPPEPAVSQAPPAQPAAKKGGGGKTLLIVGGLAAVGAGVAVAAGGGGSDSSSPPPSTGPIYPNVAGRWLGTGANGVFFVGGPCTEQDELTLQLAQSGASITGTVIKLAIRVGGPISSGCNDPALFVGWREDGTVAGSVTEAGAVQFQIQIAAMATSPFGPRAPWSFTLNGTVQANRMSGEVGGLGAITGNWSVVRQ
jgi:hypothetical protein